MSVIKIELEKPVQEFEIGGKVYEVFYDDESLKKYEKQAKVFYDKTRKEINLDEADESEVEAFENEMRELLKDTLECFFGGGSYQSIYEASGKSLINLAKVVQVLVKWMSGKLNLKQQDIKNYYTK